MGLRVMAMPHGGEISKSVFRTVKLTGDTSQNKAINTLRYRAGTVDPGRHAEQQFMLQQPVTSVLVPLILTDCKTVGSSP